MTGVELLRRRLDNHGLTRPRGRTAAEVVSRMGAVQSQDYPAARWAVALRCRTTAREMDEAFDRGLILRTHVLRPTWHFVAPADIRWMLDLTAPRVKAVTRSFYRRLEVDEALVARSNDALARALEGGRHATRAALTAALRQARVIGDAEDPLRVLGLFMRAELDAVICSGPREGRQFTYALLDDRVPSAAPLTMDAARAALAVRYFESRGPATLRDFTWWSGLTATDARAGLEAAGSRLAPVVVDGDVHWLSSRRPRAAASSARACLLPVYDEALISYRDARLSARSRGGVPIRDYGRTVVVDGRPAGTWERAATRGGVLLTIRLSRPLGRAGVRAVREAAEAYGRFVDAPVTVDVPAAPRA
jgi:hypothetical protein